MRYQTVRVWLGSDNEVEIPDDAIGVESASFVPPGGGQPQTQVTYLVPVVETGVLTAA